MNKRYKIEDNTGNSEKWACSKLSTVVFNSTCCWYELLSCSNIRTISVACYISASQQKHYLPELKQVRDLKKKKNKEEEEGELVWFRLIS